MFDNRVLNRFFNTLKGRIVFITILFLFILMLILSLFSVASFKYDKKIIVTTCDYTITSFVAEKINKDVQKHLTHAQTLSIIGDIFYHLYKTTDKNIFNTSTPLSALLTTFKDYKDVYGAGIFFEPGVIAPNDGVNYVYAFRKSPNVVLAGESVLGKKYNQSERPWYKDIKRNLRKGGNAWANPYKGLGQRSNTLMTSVGVGIYDGNKLVGIAMVDWDFSTILNKVLEIKPTPNSLVMLADIQQGTVMTSDAYFGDTVSRKIRLDEVSWYDMDLKNTDTFRYKNKTYIAFIKPVANGKSLYVCVPENELLGFIISQLVKMFIILFSISVLMSLSLFVVLKKNVNAPIDELSKAANEIGGGNLDLKVNIKTPLEFARFADVLNKMTDDIKKYIENIAVFSREKEKIESELNVARQIQYSVLPDDTFSDVKEFDIYASMDTAKEVGGDFYDYFFIDDKRFFFSIADVSGKGVPAALFMMTTKALIKSIADEKLPPDEFIKKVNKGVCADNRQEFFVTAFMGIVDITTGQITFINAGHNPPLVKKKSGKFAYLKLEANLVLGIMNNIEYKIQKSKLDEGDIIFAYTDGIVEAINNQGKLYGDERLLNKINSIKSDAPDVIVKEIKNDIKSFVQDAPPSDDVTMVVFKFNKTK